MTDTAASSGAPPAGGQLSHREILIIIGGLLLGMLLAALDQTIVGTALPTIVKELKGATELSWVFTAYLLTSTAVTPLYGKISDLYGRKRIFQVAIVLFLIGSALCGLSQNMVQLIVFRALQGIGGGGLFALALAIIGDIVPPSDRGRYQGYFGAVFGASSVAGPLLGGLFTEHLNWRWIFYINIPVGAIALFVISRTLKMPPKRTEHKIDYLGATLITASVTAVVLALTWGGGHAARMVSTPNGNFTLPWTGYAWTSPLILGLIIGSVVLAFAFIYQETRHSEPILPMRLFSRDIFSTSVALCFISGVALFGAIVFIPNYLQNVKGYSPTESGLAMIPLTIGIMFASVGSGQLVSKIGRYRIFPIVGTVLGIFAFWLLSHISVNTSLWELSIWMIIIGAAVGTFMQIPVLAIQNDVEFRDMGAATSAAIFFRGLGGALGTAIFGSIVNNQFRSSVHSSVSASVNDRINLDLLSHQYVQGLSNLGAEVPGVVFRAYAHALHILFLVGIPIMVLALVCALLLRDQPLRSHSAVGKDAHKDAPMPSFE